MGSDAATPTARLGRTIEYKLETDLVPVWEEPRYIQVTGVAKNNERSYREEEAGHANSQNSERSGVLDGDQSE